MDKKCEVAGSRDNFEPQSFCVDDGQPIDLENFQVPTQCVGQPLQRIFSSFVLRLLEFFQHFLESEAYRRL